jgi:uncharacterized protein YejL (UPF0352 family)
MKTAQSNLARGLLAAAALACVAHSPTGLAAYASASADAALVVTGGTGYQAFSFELQPSTATATIGNALATANGDVTPLVVNGAVQGVLVEGFADADALFAPPSNASASYGSQQPLFLFNLVNVGGVSNTLNLTFDWSYVLAAVNDFVAPLETANSSATLSLVRTNPVTNVATTLFSQSVATSITGGPLSDSGVFAFSHSFATGEVLAAYQVGLLVSAQASAVPLPASVLLLAPALGMLALRRRIAA